MRLLTKDIFFTIFCLCCISASAFFLHRELTTVTIGSDSQVVGTITFKRKVAQRQVANQQIWDSLKQKSTVYNFDTIRTREDSTALLKLNDGSSISISENSFIVISFTNSGFNLDFTRGSIHAKRDMAPKGKSLTISSGKTTIKVDKGNLNLKGSDKDRLDINLSSGEASIASGSVVKKIKENQVASLRGEKTTVKDNPFILTSPSQYDILMTTSDRRKVNFLWENKSDSGKSSKRSTLLIARDESFKKIIFRGKARGKFSRSLKPGLYYWMVKSSSSEKSYSKRFIIQKDSAPLMISPLNNEKISFIKELPEVSLKWHGKTKASNYKIQVSKDRTFKTSVKEMFTTNNSITTKGLTEGDYYWRIINNYSFKTGSSMIKSGVRKFSIGVKPKLSKPEQIFSLDDKDSKSVTDRIIKLNGVNFSWKADKEIYNFKFQLARDKQFRNIIFEKESSKRNILFKKDMPTRTYYWRIIAFTSDKSLSRKSDTYRLIVKPFKNISILSPGRNKYYSEGETISFNWSDPDNTNNYLLEISPDRDFSKILKSIITEKKLLKLDNFKKGNYYSRIALLGNGSNPISYSKARLFIVEEKLEKPVIIWPYKNNDLNIDELNSLTIKWKRVRGASRYLVELFHMGGANSQEKIIKYLTRSTKYSTKDFKILSEGNFYWQISALKQSKGKTIKVSKLSKRYFKIYADQINIRPEIESSKVIYVD